MKKLIITLVLVTTFINAKTQQTVDIGSDTLQWLQTNLANRNTFFNGKSLKTLLDSLYQLKFQIVEFNPPIYIEQSCNGTEENSINNINSIANPNYINVNQLTFYFQAISDGGQVWQAHRNVLDNNYQFNQNITINTHVKFFKVVFLQPVQYPRQIADSDNGTSNWKPFAEYFWGPNIIQSVSVGEY